MDLGLLSFSFSAGVIAFFNPCGFALLPAYVSYSLASGGEWPRGVLPNLICGLSVGAAMGGGFITVFAGLGLIVSLLGGALGPLLPWVGAGVGLGLSTLGGLMLLGRLPLQLPFLERWAARLIPSANPHAREQGLPFYYLYGVAYALASTSCTLPVFLIVVSSALSSGFFGGLVQFGAYALGMTLMMVGLALATVFSKEAVQRWMGPVMRVVRWAGAVGVLAAGIYLIYYNLFYAGVIPL